MRLAINWQMKLVWRRTRASPSSSRFGTAREVTLSVWYESVVGVGWGVVVVGCGGGGVMGVWWGVMGWWDVVGVVGVRGAWWRGGGRGRGGGEEAQRVNLTQFSTVYTTR